jgi:hypothetical protein
VPPAPRPPGLGLADDPGQRATGQPAGDRARGGRPCAQIHAAAYGDLVRSMIYELEEA